MKRFAKWMAGSLAGLIVLVAAVALAAPDADPWVSNYHQYLWKVPARFNVEVGANFVDAGSVTVNTGLVVSAGKTPITKIIPCPRIDWDFAAVIPRPGFIQETDKATCTGVSAGDPCFVGARNATPQDGGSSWEDNIDLTCIARGVNQVQIRMTTASGDGGVTNPPDAGMECICMSTR